MNKPTLSLKPAAIAGLLAAHGEKIVFAAVIIPSLLLAWWGIDAIRSQSVRQDRTPKAVSELVAKADENIERVAKIPAERLPPRTPLKPLIDPWRPHQVKIAAAPDHPPLLNRPLFAEMTKRTRPEVFPIEDLRAVAGIAVLPDMKPEAPPPPPPPPPPQQPAAEGDPKDPRGRPGGKPPKKPSSQDQAEQGSLYGDGTQGTSQQAPPEPQVQQRGVITPFVVVTGLIPTARQQAEYERRFRSVSFRDPQRDKPRWGDYLVERARVSKDGGRLRWERMAIKDVERADRNGRIGDAAMPGAPPMEQESLPPGFFLLEPEETEIEYAAALPQRIDGPWGTAAVHPWFIPRLEEFRRDPAADKPDDRPIPVIPFGEFLADGKARAGDVFRLEKVVVEANPERQRDVELFKFAVRSAKGGEAAEIRTIGLTAQTVFAISEQWGRQLSVDGTTEKPRSCHLRVRVDMIGKTPVGRILAMEFLDEDGAVSETRTEPNPAAKAAEGFGPIAGGGPVAAGGSPAIALAENRLFRFVDTDVKPGESYRYRVKLAVRNPNVGLTPQHVADASVAKGEFLVSVPSNETEVSVPETNILLVRTIDWDTAKKMGLKGEALEVMVLGRSEKTGNFALRSTITGVGGLANVDTNLNKSGSPRFFGEEIVTDRLLVDARGTQTERGSGREQELAQPLDLLFRRPGSKTFELVTAADSERQILRYGSTLFQPGTQLPGNDRTKRPNAPPGPNRNGAAQPGADGTGPETLLKVESSQLTKEYSDHIRDNTFADKEKKFLTETLLPQLAKPDNLPSITRTRQRIRELALRNAAQELVDPINALIRDAMVRQAFDEKAEPHVRVNAMLMVGELVDADNKPWPAAVAALAQAVADKSRPLEVRIAALAGLGRHVGDGRQVSKETATIAGQVVAGLLQPQPAVDPVADRWIVARALELLPAVAAPPAAVAAVAGILADGKGDLDLRVRAAMALGKLAQPDVGIDAVAAVDQVRELAIALLDNDLAAAKDRRFARVISPQQGAGAVNQGETTAASSSAPSPDPAFGGGVIGNASGSGVAAPARIDEDSVPSLACRRNAWRLVALANAIGPARSGPGLAALLKKDAATAADDLADALRAAGTELNDKPEEATVERVVKKLRRIAAIAREEPPAGRGEPPRTQPPSPFDQPAEGPVSDR